LHYYFLKTMKFHAVFFGLLLVLATATRVSAQFIPYDSIPIDSVFFATDTTYLDSIQGGADQRQAHMGEGDYFAVQFATSSHQVVFMDSGSVLHVYWSRVSSDSCAMDIQFQNYNFSGTPILGPTVHIIESGPENVWNMTTVVVPDTGYNTLQISLGASGNAGEPGADSCFLDAIVLIQGGTASVAQGIGAGQPVLANYPNPFYHASGTRIQVHAPAAGIGTLSVMDALGHEVARVPLGAIGMGDQEVSLALEHAGIFFVRLYMDGAPVGSPLEISGE
jgi:hypothetical protein